MSKSDIVLPDFKYREYEEIKDSAGQPLIVIHPLHPDFPPQIRILKDEISLPAILYLRGNVAILNRPGVAIVGKRNAGKAVLKMGIPTFVVVPDFFADNPEGNRQLIANGCQAWDPTAGTASILASINSLGVKKTRPAQRNLFEKMTGDK